MVLVMRWKLFVAIAMVWELGIAHNYLKHLGATKEGNLPLIICYKKDA